MTDQSPAPAEQVTPDVTGCSIEGCDSPHNSHGFCKKHAHRWRRHGDPLGGGAPHDSETKRRFIHDAAAQVGNEGSPCIDWLWGVDDKGYARTRVGTSARRVAQLVLEASRRPRPAAPRNLSLHSCDRPICIAPYHLRWGTQQENAADRLARGRVRNGATGPLTGDAT